MRKFLLGTLAVSALLVACGDKTSGEVKIDPPEKTETKPKPVKSKKYNLAAQYKKFAPVQMKVDTSFLSPSETLVVNKLMEIHKPMNAIFLSQLDANNAKTRKDIAASDLKNKKILLKMFDLHFGVCDGLEDGKVFYGDTPCPKGGGFYPADMTKKEFERWIKKHPEDEAAFTSGFTVIRRKGKRLVAVPYSKAYKGQLTRIAGIA